MSNELLEMADEFSVRGSFPEPQIMGFPQPKPKPRFTVEQYLAIERRSEERCFYLDGEIYAMPGESLPHGDISVNLVGLLFNYLKGKPCRALTKDTKVRSGPTLKAGKTSRSLFSYPDIVVVCGEPEYHDEKRDVILNPKVVVEVLSPSTEAFDRGEKFSRYQEWNATLNDYLLVSQDQPQIEHFTRQPDGSWSYKRFTELEASVAIPSIDCVLKLADVYDRVPFPDE